MEKVLVKKIPFQVYAISNGLLTKNTWYGSCLLSLFFFFNRLSDYVRVMDMGLLELTITAVKSDSDEERVSIESQIKLNVKFP